MGKQSPARSPSAQGRLLYLTGLCHVLDPDSRVYNAAVIASLLTLTMLIRERQLGLGFALTPRLNGTPLTWYRGLDRMEPPQRPSPATDSTCGHCLLLLDDYVKDVGWWARRS